MEISLKTGNLWGQAYNNMLIGFVTLDRGEADRALQRMQDSIRQGDQAGLIASSVGERAELGWVYGSYGDIEKGLATCRESLNIALAKLPVWKALPLAMIVRLQLLKGDLPEAEATAGPERLDPITIPYARYTLLVEMANIELALAQKEFARALSIIDDLRGKIPMTIRPDIPELLCHKGEALFGLGKIEAAQQVLHQAQTLAETLGSRQSLWRIFSLLAVISEEAGQHAKAESCRESARLNASYIADCLQRLGMKERFLNKPDVKAIFN
jgi:tetratricopeptide (TPR) repeat protein